MSDLLRIQNLEKRYDDFDLEGISLSVLAGSVVGFIGSNGAGKTTTIKAILGLIRPDGGSISLFGEEVTGAPEKRLANSSNASAWCSTRARSPRSSRWTR